MVITASFSLNIPTALCVHTDSIRDAFNAHYFKCIDNHEESITFPYFDEKGLGFNKKFNCIEYYSLDDYNLHLKMHGLYPLFYSDANAGHLLRIHENYPGYTVSRPGTADFYLSVFEPCDSQSSSRKAHYRRLFICELYPLLLKCLKINTRT
jgi:hypothetical protein